MSIIEWREIKDESAPGLTWKMRVHEDYYVTPDDADCYTTSQKRAWRNGDWQFVGLEVIPQIAGQASLEYLSESLWGIEYGNFLVTTEDDEKIERRMLDLDYLIRDEYYVPSLISESKARLVREIGPLIDALRAAQAALAA